MLRWFKEDGETPWGLESLQKVGAGETYHGKYGDYARAVLKNVSAEPMHGVMLMITQQRNDILHEMLSIAIGEESPGAFSTFEDEPIEVGTLIAGGTVNVWINVVVPAWVPPRNESQAAIRAYGSSA
jgi:hypothetical protein